MTSENTERLGEHVKVRAGSGSGSGPPFRLTAVHVEAPPDQVEAVARRLLTAFDEANAAYPDRYPAWRRERDDRIAEERLREQRRFAAKQAILDRVMDEHRSNHGTQALPVPSSAGQVKQDNGPATQASQDDQTADKQGQGSAADPQRRQHPPP